MTTKLTKTQLYMLTMLADGEMGAPSGGAKAAAWWRTVNSLAARRLVQAAPGPEGHAWYGITDAGRKALAE